MPVRRHQRPAGVFSDASKVVGLVPTSSLTLAGQPVYAVLGTGSQGGTLVIPDPGEVVTPTSEAWRAVSMTVPDDRAVVGSSRPATRSMQS